MKNLAFLLGVAALVGAGCASLPKVTPFVEATSQVRSSAQTGFDALQRSLLADELGADPPVPAQDQKRLKAVSDTVARALTAMTAYAAALDQLAESGASGEKSAARVADALKGIADQLAPPGVQQALDFGTDVLTKVYGRIARVRAARQLTEVVGEADSVVRDVSGILSQMLGQLQRFNRAAFRLKTAALTDDGTFNKYALDYETSLVKNQKRLLEELGLVAQFQGGQSSREALDALRKMDSLHIRTARDVEPRQVELVNLLKSVQDERQRLAPDLARLETNHRRLVEQFNLTDQLFAKTNAAVRAWAKAHAGIKTELGKKGTPGFQELTELAKDLKELQEKLKSLN